MNARYFRAHPDAMLFRVNEDGTTEKLVDGTWTPCTAFTQDKVEHAAINEILYETGEPLASTTDLTEEIRETEAELKRVRILASDQQTIIAQLRTALESAKEHITKHRTSTLEQHQESLPVIEGINKVLSVTIEGGLVRTGREESLSKLIQIHATEREENPYCYFELAYARQTGWMAWICSNMREHDPLRIVHAKGQGDTPEDAARSAIEAYTPSADVEGGGQ